jgi:hypothetical protein
MLLKNNNKNQKNKTNSKDKVIRHRRNSKKNLARRNKAKVK